MVEADLSDAKKESLLKKAWLSNKRFAGKSTSKLVTSNLISIMDKLISPSDKVFVAGAGGMVGQAVVRALKKVSTGDVLQWGFITYS